MKRRQWVTRNNLTDRARQMTSEAADAYERYALAPARFADKGQDAVRQEQSKAIEAMVPGTLYYFHLYFIDLSKRKEFSDLSEAEAELYKKFEKKFSKTKEFLEVETAFKVVRKLEQLPKTIDERTKTEDVDAYLDTMEYIDTQINDSQPYNFGSNSRPAFMNTQAQHEGQSSQSEDDEKEMAQEFKQFDSEKFFNKISLLDDALSHFKRYNDEYKQKCKTTKDKIDREAEYSIHAVKYYQVFNEIDWSQFEPVIAYNQANRLSQDNSSSLLQLFEMTSESFWNQVYAYFKFRFDYQNEEIDPKDKKITKKSKKFNIDDQLFNAMTLDQMDDMNRKLKDMGIDIKSKKAYVQAYFSKQFNDELSQEYQENLSNEEKFRNLESMYQYAKSNDLHKGLISSLLEQMLQMTLKLDLVREDLFKEYIQRPTELNHHIKIQSIKTKNQKSQYKLQHWNQQCLQNVQVRSFNRPNESYSTQSNLIARYLRIICTKNQGQLSAYEDHFEEDYLKEIEKQVQVYLTDKGLIDLGDEFSPEEYMRIQDQVILRFKETNKEKFKVEESVKIQVELKNIQELVIKVFEFNTETFYRKNMKPLDTSIDLQGLEPSFMKRETDLFKGVKKNKILTHEFVFDELIDKIGTFIIEFQGNGKLSRVVIKKGSLTLIHKTTKGGHVAYIIDEKRNICMSNDGKTGVLADDKFYSTDVNKNGAIFIPYTKESSSKVQKVIMITPGFSQLGQFQRDTEMYNFEAFFHLNAESVLVGHNTKIFVRPKLTLNNRAISVKSLKSSSFDLTITDHDGKKVNYQVKDPKLSDSEDYVYEFLVPSNISTIAASLSASVKNLSKNKVESLGTRSENFRIKHHRDDHKLYEMYLKQIGSEYFIYCLGKNGEPLVKQKISITAHHIDFEGSRSESLTLDQQGRVKLGQLKGVNQIRASVNTELSSFEDSWKIVNEMDQWTQPSDINIIQGESVEIPINFQGQPEELTTYQLSLKKKSSTQVLQNLTKTIKIEPSRMGTYKQISLKNLEVGQYVLKLNMTASQHMRINITVHQGEYWQGSFILQKNQLREYSASTETLRIEQTTCKKVEGADDAYNVSVQLDNFTDNSRVHLLATQFMPQHSNSLKDLLDRYCAQTISSVTFEFAKWQNHYSDSKDMGDEILYVLNRKQQTNLMGNLLDNPSLLMRRQYVRDTTTAKENLKQAQAFEQVQLQQMADLPQFELQNFAPPALQSMAPMALQNCAPAMKLQQAAPMMRKKMAKAYYHGSTDQIIENKIKEYQNFMKSTPQQIFNLQPNKDGVVSATLKGFSKYVKLYIIACDGKSTAQRQQSVSQLLNHDEPQQKQMAQTDKILKKDLRQKQRMPTTKEDGKTQGGLIELRQTLTLSKDQTVHLNDVGSSKYQVIADLQQIRKVITLIHGNYKDQLIDDVILNWHTFSEQQKLNNFNDNVCHELNFFLARKDSAFFKSHVVDYIANKIEWTFFDIYLLARYADNQKFAHCEQELSRILTQPAKISTLPILEKSLAVEFGLWQKDATVKERARKICQNMIDKLQATINEQFDEEDQRQNTILIDGILEMQNENKPTFKMKARKQHGANIQQEFYQEEMMQQNCDLLDMVEEKCFQMRNASYGELDYDEEDQSSDEEEEKEMDGFGITSYSNRRAAPQRRVQSRAFGGPPPRAAMNRNISRAMPEMKESERKSMQTKVAKKAKFKNALFDDDDDFFSQQYESKKVALVQFEDLENTKEYKETHYSDKHVHANCSHPPESIFLRDYLQNLINHENKPFVSSAFTYLSKDMFYFGLATLDLPSSIDTFEKYPHQIESDGHRGIVIKAGDEAIIFKKEIKEGAYNLKKDLIITHKYQSVTEPNHGAQKDDDEEHELKYFVINHIYECEVAVTNLTNKHKKTTLLFQVPNGSLPVLRSKYIDTRNIELTPFKTETFKFQFYFPHEGEFEHYPTNAFKDDAITTVSEIKKLDVKKKQVITKVTTFKDLMMLTKTDQEKKKKILELLNDNYKMTTEKNYQFSWQSIQFLMDEDKDFFFKISQIYFDHFDEYPQMSRVRFQHLKDLLKNKDYIQHRHELFQQIKLSQYHLYKGNVFSYILRPIKTPIFEIDSREIYQDQYRHLEYFPIINTRVFQIGSQSSTQDSDSASNEDGGSKNINNVQFKETYRSFLLLNANQEFSKDDNKQVQRDLFLRMAYYLLLQDRVQESYKIFNYVLFLQQSDTAQTSSLGGSGPIHISCGIAIDYMHAYFDFQLPKNDGFKTAREIVQKYKNKNANNFRYRKYFQKLELQLQEYDEQVNTDKLGAMNETEKEAVEKELNKKLIPSIHDVKVDEKSGAITVESSNIDQFDINYYLIDAEILFSRSPFVQNEAEKFSYVKPYIQLNASAKKGEKTQVQLPEQLNHKNVIIEIKSNELQRFAQHFSCDLKVQIEEQIGEMRVFQKSTMQSLPKVYVKVFVMQTNGTSVFFKDGFTDIRGKFEYAKASGSSDTKSSSFKKFAIFISDSNLGSLIKDADATKLLSEPQLVIK